MAYDPKSIEPKWQQKWETRTDFKAVTGDPRPKYYILDMFPYPSGAGLHVGHVEGYTATDIIARYKRAQGFNVLHPMGWDAFGLPAEQYALQTGVHPAVTTFKAIDNFRRQLKRLGLSYDWSRETATCDPKFYRWTQFIFLKLFEKGLAYQKEVPVNWCPALKTVLANEEVVDGKSERGGHPVYRVPMKQWMLKITAYAERLLKDLDKVDWPESTKELQRNWIGRSEGLEVDFQVAESSDKIRVFTTRGDTLFGVTFLVLAPEHPWVQQRAASQGFGDQNEKVSLYCAQAAQKSELSRQEQSQEKTGVFSGHFALHPVTGERIPIWIADYVLMGYGTGAIMAVPGHDERDHEFATRFQLSIKQVVDGGPEAPECFSGEGVAIHSDFLTGMPTSKAKEAMAEWVQKNGVGQKTVNYKLRDWLFSRQRYWGEPIPAVYLDGQTQALPINELPLILPEVQSYEPSGTGQSPLAGITEWVNTLDPRTGKPAQRETDTMPGSAGSSWYFLRFCDPDNAEAPFSLAAEKYWMPVDLYVGGQEHAVGHLLYSRFWTKVLADAGLVTHDEPFQRLVHQGVVLGEDGERMSKSRGNVINPDHVIENYGTDTLRIYEMFMGPFERDKPWSTHAIEGVHRFLQRSWRLFVDEEGESDIQKWLVSESEPSEEDLKITHQTIRKVTEDIENLRFNTAISQMMIFVNHFTKSTDRPRRCLRPFVQLLNPFAPHLAEELWEKLGETSSLTLEKWPQFDPQWVQEDMMTIAVQVMGKTRGTIEVSVNAAQSEIEELARKLSTVQNQLKDKQIRKVIYVKRKILNWVVS